MLSYYLHGQGFTTATSMNLTGSELPSKECEIAHNARQWSGKSQARVSANVAKLWFTWVRVRSLLRSAICRYARVVSSELCPIHA